MHNRGLRDLEHVNKHLLRTEAQGIRKNYIAGAPR